MMIGIVLGIGVGGWVYAKLQRYTGGNTQSSLIGAGLCGALAALVAITLLGLLF